MRKAAAVRKSSNGIAAHGFRADAKTEFDFFQRDGISSLADRFDAGAADALHEQRRPLNRNT